MPVNPAVERLFQAVANEVKRLGIKNAVFGVADPATGQVKVTNTKGIERHEGLRNQIAAVFGLTDGGSDQGEVPTTGFGSRFGGG